LEWEGENKYLAWVEWEDYTPDSYSGRVWKNRGKAIEDFGLGVVEELEQRGEVGIEIVLTLGEIHKVLSLSNPTCPDRKK